jgi:hypothetical protein
MLGSLKRIVRLIRIRQNAAFMAFMQRQIDDLRERYSGDKRLEPAGYKVFSQGDEDGVDRRDISPHRHDRPAVCRVRLRRWFGKQHGLHLVSGLVRALAGFDGIERAHSAVALEQRDRTR